MSKRKNAKEIFNRIKKNFNNCYVIHYSCESFIDKEEGYSPRISSIAIKYLNSGQVYSFAIHKIAELKKIKKSEIENHYDELERLMLDEYFNFMKENSSSYFVHWNMRDINYGFEAIKQRYKVLEGESYDIDSDRLLDLAKLLKEYYGSNYIDHPRLQRLVELNNISNKDLLTGAEEAQAFLKKDYIKLHLSTLRKVECIEEILTLQLNGKLKTKVNRLAQIINNLYDHEWFKLSNIILSITGLLAIIYNLWKILF